MINSEPMKPPIAEKLRAWWSHKQALDGCLDGAAPADVLAATGWARSLGGVGPYLTLAARAGTSREAVDAAVAGLSIHELPAARNCTYVVPAADFALALKAGVGFSTDIKTVMKLGVTEKEIARLCEAVVSALAKGPLEPDEIRESAGPAVRNLGEEGKKKGVTTTLPVALNQLQTEGEIRRVPIDGRLDRQRYRYALWHPNPLANWKLAAAEITRELARRYFAWTGPATIAEFQWFSALSLKAAKAAIEPLGLTPLAPPHNDRLMFPEDLEKLETFQVPKQAQYRLVSSIDGISLLRRDLKSIVEPADFERMVTRERASGELTDLPSHAIVDRGRVVGIWEYDPARESIAWLPFIARNRDLEKAVAGAEEYIRSQLGDARSFSLDSPKSRIPRIEVLRKAAAR
jgi:hypothetical protein